MDLENMAWRHWQPSCTLAVARERAELYAHIRAYMRDSGCLEVDTPVLQGGANADHGIAPFRLPGADGRFLVTSPEHHLKRCLAAGWGDVYALSPCFRQHESGRRHNPEFRMLEWYRLGWDELRLAEECVALCRQLSGLAGDCEWLSYDEAFQRYAGVHPQAPLAALQAAAGNGAEACAANRNALLDWILVERVEPQLGRGTWCVLHAYPPDQAAQARLRNGYAARFELYRDGLELANGYHECTDVGDLRQRLARETEHLDERYLAACTELPDCAGVALGLDRLLMLRLGINDIRQVLSFDWARC